MKKGEVIKGKDGYRILTSEDEAFDISREVSKAGTRFAITPVALDDIFFYLVNLEGGATQVGNQRELEAQRKNRSGFSQILAGILVNSIYEMRNYPVVLVNTVLSPLSFLILITFVSRGALLGEAVEGGLVMSMFSAGMSLQGDMSHLKNDFKLQDMVVSSPTKWPYYMLGMAASEIVYAIPALAVLGILGVYLVHLNVFGLLHLLPYS